MAIFDNRPLTGVVSGEMSIGIKMPNHPKLKSVMVRSLLLNHMIHTIV